MNTPNQTPKSRSAFAEALDLSLNLGFQIAIPLVGFALAGRFLDGRFHTGPWLFLASVVLAIMTSTYLLIRKFSQIIRKT